MDFWVCSSRFKMNWLVSMKRSTQFTKQASARLSNFGPGLSMHFSQQALHVDGRARISDERLQLPLAARARPVPRRGLRGAGHFPRRRGPAHAASPGLAPPAEPPPGPAARRCLRSRPARPGAARHTASPPLSLTRAARPVASSPGPGGRERGRGARAAPPRPRGSGR